MRPSSPKPPNPSVFHPGDACRSRRSTVTGVAIRSMSTPALLTLSSLTSFVALFWGLRSTIFSKKSLKVVNHAVSAVHAVVMIALGAGILQSPARALSLVGKATSDDMVSPALSDTSGGRWSPAQLRWFCVRVGFDFCHTPPKGLHGTAGQGGLTLLSGQYWSTLSGRDPCWRVLGLTEWLPGRGIRLRFPFAASRIGSLTGLASSLVALIAVT